MGPPGPPASTVSILKAKKNKIIYFLFILAIQFKPCSIVELIEKSEYA